MQEVSFVVCRASGSEGPLEERVPLGCLPFRKSVSSALRLDSKQLSLASRSTALFTYRQGAEKEVLLCFTCTVVLAGGSLDGNKVD